MKLISKMIVLCAALAVCSCGYQFEFSTDVPKGEGLSLSYNEIDLHVGDSITFETELRPDSVKAS